MSEFFANNAKLITFIHVLGAFIWVGGMIIIRFAIHLALAKIDNPKVKLEITLNILKNFFNLVIGAIVAIIGTAVVLAVGLGFKGTDLYMVIHIKEAIWTIMTGIFVFIYIKRNRAQRAFDENNFELAKKELSLLPKYFIPLNIILGLFALYFGITLRGF